MSPVQKHLVIHGAVQGVGYRWSMAQAAEALGVRGWVRNRRDGTVEALAVGDAAAVEALVRWAHRGPPEARVDRVEVLAPRDQAGAPEGFEQRATV
ncbi:acylphosphatase [Variovorax sp. J31P207]|uniref:acylphosphatase n=1 Tax=Variovorax sp. J31P207 TaxID=3053510 RepID=UPI002577E52F|nr:acylphosphatase [Variovorax sp. J31P207]MDM0071159.1 acylphosphatase [Variovorax sp. J31P207]